jgi:hypothetical protein
MDLIVAASITVVLLAGVFILVSRLKTWLRPDRSYTDVDEFDGETISEEFTRVEAEVGFQSGNSKTIEFDRNLDHYFEQYVAADEGDRQIETRDGTIKPKQFTKTILDAERQHVEYVEILDETTYEHVVTDVTATLKTEYPTENAGRRQADQRMMIDNDGSQFIRRKP